MDIRTEKFGGRNVRFVALDGEWWAYCKDVCDALKVHPKDLWTELGFDSEHYKDVRPDGKLWTVIDEVGIYQAMCLSNRMDAKRFRLWSLDILKKLRSKVGLQGYEVFRMADEDVQEEIDRMLDTIYWDEEKQCVMQSVTVAGGDVEQVPLEGF